MLSKSRTCCLDVVEFSLWRMVSDARAQATRADMMVNRIASVVSSSRFLPVPGPRYLSEQDRERGAENFALAG